ncbi:ATP-binding protein [Enterobacter kobei]|nr:ATP-binding protein [Enterobacter kobei]
MLCSIDKIDIPVRFSSKRAEIDLYGKSLIITGNNGCGKTSFITQIFEHLNKAINNHNENDLDYLKNQLNWYNSQLTIIGRDDNVYSTYLAEKNRLEKRIEELLSFNIITTSNDITEIRSLLRFHDATRQSKIVSPTEVPKHSSLIKNNQHFGNDIDGSNIFESYLLSLKKNQSYAISFDKNEEKALGIKSWFVKIENDLRSLFEDPKLTLEFNTSDEKFYLIQDGKEKYTFQNISSGFSSILSIYTDLVMRVEMWGVTPENIQGIIFIDEIDAHLHVSLQKQILRFFMKAFPKVQFIVTTHSPFVVTSVTDAVIYDLSSNEQIIDVSSYSYGIVMEELFGVATESHALTDKLRNIESLIKNINHSNIEEIDNEISSLAVDQSNMSEDAQAFLDRAKLELLKSKKRIQG